MHCGGSLGSRVQTPGDYLEPGLQDPCKLARVNLYGSICRLRGSVSYGSLTILPFTSTSVALSLSLRDSKSTLPSSELWRGNQWPLRTELLSKRLQRGRGCSVIRFPARGRCCAARRHVFSWPWLHNWASIQPVRSISKDNLQIRLGVFALPRVLLANLPSPFISTFIGLLILCGAV